MTAEYSAFGSKRVRGAGGWAGGRVEVAGKLTPGSGGGAAWVQEGIWPGATVSEKGCRNCILRNIV